MRRWLGGGTHRRVPAEPPDRPPDAPDTTDDPLAAIGVGACAVAAAGRRRPVYSVSRVNPLFQHTATLSLPQDENPKKPERDVSRQSSPPSGEKSGSSGYGGSHGSIDPIYLDHLRLEDPSAVLETNPAFVKSIRIAGRGVKPSRSVPSHNSVSSGAGTLTTIPEGQVDLVPQPIWPLDEKKGPYDSLVDDALLLYTSLSYVPDKTKDLESYIDLSVKDLLVDLLASINQTLEGENLTAEDMLKVVDEKIRSKLELLKNSTEEEMRKLCVNLSNSKKVSSVLRAFSNTSSSGNSSQTSGRARTTSLETEDIYQIPSGSSSSGFSDSTKEQVNNLPVFVHEDLVSVPNGLRNAMIYGTLCRAKVKKNGKDGQQKKNGLLVDDGKPSVWMQYYGVKAVENGAVKTGGKPTDVPLYPGGRPEADFTLDLPRSELLSRRMREAKKWRCRCRLLASFLGLVFFLLSVMAVSLMLTRGRRMFGSMV